MKKISSKNLRSSIAGVALALSLGIAAPAHAAPSVQLTYGVTQVALSSDFVGALGSLGVTPDNILPGSLYVTSRGARAAFPIPTGELDANGPKLEILHSGGLTLTAGDTRVALSSFIIENLGGALQLTGVVKVNNDIIGRIPLFNVALTAAPELTTSRSGKLPGRSTKLSVEGANVTLTATAASALNGVFGVSAFTEGFPIGVAQIDARVSDLDK